jgi:hypothetical protein
MLKIQKNLYFILVAVVSRFEQLGLPVEKLVVSCKRGLACFLLFGLWYQYKVSVCIIQLYRYKVPVLLASCSLKIVAMHNIVES